MAPVAVLGCLKCGADLPQPQQELQAMRCVRCGQLQEVEAFPAWKKPRFAVVAPPEVVAEGDAVCFFHPTREARIVCRGCGRFVCSLCELKDEMGREWCPDCFNSEHQKKIQETGLGGRKLMDGIALALALCPFTLVLLYFSFLTAPAAVAVGLVALKQKPGLLPRGRWRAWVAIVLGLAQIVLWGLLLYYGIFGKKD
jgi:hypothetical protein